MLDKFNYKWVWLAANQFNRGSEEMKMSNRLARNAKNHFIQAFRKGKTVTRTELKQANNGKSANYDVISSQQSMTKHLSAINQVAIYIQDTYKVRDWKNVDVSMIQDFLNHMQKNGGRSGAGASEKTLKGYVTAINKVMVTARVWDEADVVSLSSLEIEKGKTHVNKILTSDEWIRMNHDKYLQYQIQIDFARAFGIRREEMFGQKSMQKRGKNGVTANSLFIDDDNRLYAQVIGKGGKMRVAKCREDMNVEMLNRYEPYARSLSYCDSDKERFKRENYRGQKIIDGIDNAIPLHIYRNEYVRQRVIEESMKYGTDSNSPRIGYSRLKMEQGVIVRVGYDNDGREARIVENGTITKIKTLEADVRAFMTISQELGHNRLDVMTKYL